MIDPAYTGAVLHVLDASRAVGVAGMLMSKETGQTLRQEIKAEYAGVRAEREGKQPGSRLLTLEEARDRRLAIDWREYRPPQPVLPEVKVFDSYPVAELVGTIDWTPFFAAWRLPGKFPHILEHTKYGAEAQQLYADAQRMLQRIGEEGLLTARGVVGIFPANAHGDDIVLFRDEERREQVATLHGLRQQRRSESGRSNLCLADFVAPIDSGLPDHLGAFVVSAGFGVESAARACQEKGDDYDAIMIKALADRLAESFAERLHQYVRTEIWAYAPEEKLSNEELIAEAYRGIRPAPGYPACPDHTEKSTLWRLLDAEQKIGVSLTETFAMVPAASVSGWYFSHPKSSYFGLGKIDRDQVTDYARRKGVSVAEIERWLAPNLGYNPEPKAT
jgi:5-methyltetrahydrofolate--homocysteine methyltransferase